MEIFTKYSVQDYEVNDNNDFYDQIHDHEINKIRKYLIKEYEFSNDEIYESSLIDHIDEIQYTVKDQEQKFKIFDDISSVTRNMYNQIELVINIPKSCDIITINKIKLPKKIKKNINDIFVTLDDNIIISRDELYNHQIILSENCDNFNNNNYNLIDCSKGDVNIHIILEPNSINSIINNNIYINFSYLNLKNKHKIKLYLE